MFGLDTLDVAIGLIFVYLLVSIIASAVREAIEGVFKARAAFLWLGIRELLHDKNLKGLAKSFYEHPLIFSLFPGDFNKDRGLDKPHIFAWGRGAPSYIPSKNFAVALMDLAARGSSTNEISSGAGSPVISLDNIRANIANLGNERVQRVLLTAIDTAQGDIDKAQANIEAWYNSAMDRVSGWYKRNTQYWLFIIGLGVAVGMNVNTLTIVDYLYRTPAVRDAIVKKAEAVAQDKDFLANMEKKEPKDRYTFAEKQLMDLKLPVGWKGVRRATGADWKDDSAIYAYVAVPIVGWLMTAFAATLGAPFWFDLLNKVMVIRSTVKPHEKSPEEASEDRQPKTQPPAPPQAPAPQPQPPQAPPPQGAAAPPAPPPQPSAEERASDIEADVDACDAEITTHTEDAALPQATTRDGGAQ